MSDLDPVDRGPWPCMTDGCEADVILIGSGSYQSYQHTGSTPARPHCKPWPKPGSAGPLADPLEVIHVGKYQALRQRAGWAGDELRPKDPVWAGRSFWHVPDLDAMPDGEADANEVYDLDNDARVKLQCLTEAAADVANVVGSELHRQDEAVDQGDRLHAPVLDIDYGARLVPSSTPGHYHLYLDRPITWRRYAIVLAVLGWAGIIEPGYARAGLRRRGTFARLRPSKPT